MHKNDLMTPIERLTAFMTGKPMGRVLSISVYGSVREYSNKH